MNEIVPGLVKVKLVDSRAAELDAQNTLVKAVRAPFPLSGAVYESRIEDSGWTIWQIPSVNDPRQVAQYLRSQRGVLNAEPVNVVYPLFVHPDDPDFDVIETEQTNPNVILVLNPDTNPSFRRLWHLTDTNAEAAWGVWPNSWYTASTKPTNAPLVAVIDSGCDTGHPDFANAGNASTDSALGGQLTLALCSQFRYGHRITNSPNYQDGNGHGTHVAGLALASGNNGGFNGHGVIGTGFNSRGMILKVITDNGTGTDADAAAAIYYAANKGADVINLSLGTTNYSQIFQDAVRYAWQKGSLIVAAGNENGNGGGNLGPIYPAACSGALGVTANGPDGQPATGTYTGYGSYVDVAAPGGDVIQTADYFILQYIWSTAVRGDSVLANDPNIYPPYTPEYTYLIGTSMATPIVSGAAGLYYGYHHLKSTAGWANVRAYKAIEKSSATVMGAPYGGWEPVQGYGCLDMWSMLMDTNSRGATVGGVEGQVLIDGTPISNVAVRAKKTGGMVTYSTTTLADGTYRFEGMPPGTYSVWTAPQGALKTKKLIVELGCDLTGFDFWCGTYTGDTTAPTIRRFKATSLKSGVLTLNTWAFDTETGIDKLEVTVGTTPGGSDVQASTEVVAKNATPKLTGLATTPGTTYYVTGVYTNGNGTTSTASATVVAQ